MNRELYARLVGELGKPGLLWETGQDHESQERATLQWLPIAKLTDARIELGLSSNASWVRATPQSVTVFRSDNPCVFLLPVLEINPDELRQLLGHGLQARGLSTEFIRVFPFEVVVATGLESHSERWAGLALKWAEHLDASSRLQNALGALATNGPTQKLRHAAQKLLARQRKSGTGEQRHE